MNTQFLIGSTVEHTPAFSKRTLFIKNKHTIQVIEEQAKLHNVQHISFYTPGSIPKKEIEYFLANGYWVTLEYMAADHTTIVKSLGDDILKHRLFVPMLTVTISGIENIGPNFTIKVGDLLPKVNSGTWSMHYSEVTDSNRFTEWKEYPDYIESEDQSIVEDNVVADIEPTYVANNNELGVDDKSDSALKPEETTYLNQVDTSELKTLESIAKEYTK